VRREAHGWVELRVLPLDEVMESVSLGVEGLRRARATLVLIRHLDARAATLKHAVHVAFVGELLLQAPIFHGDQIGAARRAGLHEATALPSD